jgi:two-component system sensor histidine kinase VicK
MSLPPDVAIERAELISNKSLIPSTVSEILSRAVSCMAICVEGARFRSSVNRQYKQAIVNAHKRGIAVKVVTEITKENIEDCKALLSISQLYHVDGIKGNFAVTDTEYFGAVSLEDRQTISQLIHSNSKQIVEQHKFLFESLCAKAIPARQKIREVEEGIPPLRTEIIRETDNATRIAKTISNSTYLYVCASFKNLRLLEKVIKHPVERLLEDYRSGKHKGVRWIGSIEKEDDIEIVNRYLALGMEIKHSNAIPVDFLVTDNEFNLIMDELDEHNSLHPPYALVSNEPAYIDHFHVLFERLWNERATINAYDRILEVQEGIEPEEIRIMSNPAEVQKLYIDMINSAMSEVSLIIATPNALHRAKKFGVIDLLSKAAKERGVKVNLIIPGYKEQEDSDMGNQDSLPSAQLFGDIEGLSTLYPNLEVRRNVPFIRQTSKIKSTFLIVDRFSLLIVDLKDDSKDDFMLATGYATYSSSMSRTQSFSFIFDTIWRQAELYEKLKKHDNMQREFINIAAHELRTPTQAIVGYSEMMLNFPEKKEVYYNAISRNADRLIRLSSDILDVARIESQTLKLNKSSFDLNEKIKNAITDVKESSHWTTGEKSQNIKIIFEPGMPLIVEADKLRIFQVVSNLLNNALKFTDKGSITISTAKDTKVNEAIVKVTDTGKGLDKEILPRLFTKFASKSDKGTGLGLFISKAMIEAHGGRVEGYNNPEANGATFVFTLPLS